MIGAGLAPWRAGVVRHSPAIWLGIAALEVLGLGIMLAAISARPAITRG